MFSPLVKLAMGGRRPLEAVEVERPAARSGVELAMPDPSGQEPEAVEAARPAV